MNDQPITGEERKRRESELRRRRAGAKRLLRSLGFSHDDTHFWIVGHPSPSRRIAEFEGFSTRDGLLAGLLAQARQEGMEEARRQMREALGVLR